MKLDTFIDKVDCITPSNPVFKDYMVVSVRLPQVSGKYKNEVIVNRMTNYETKRAYYLNAYDDNFCLTHNPEIKIMGIKICSFSQLNQVIADFIIED